MEQSIMIGAANYVVTRQFSEGKRKKQDLFFELLCQKLDDTNLVDCEDEYEI